MRLRVLLNSSLMTSPLKRQCYFKSSNAKRFSPETIEKAAQAVAVAIVEIKLLRL